MQKVTEYQQSSSHIDALANISNSEKMQSLCLRDHQSNAQYFRVVSKCLAMVRGSTINEVYSL